MPRPTSCKAVAGPQRRSFRPVPARLRQAPLDRGRLPVPALLPARPLLAALARAQNISENRAGRVENRQELQGNRQQRRDEVRNQVAENHPRMDFWSNNPGWAAWRISAPYRWATWGLLGGWIGYGAGKPSSYAYGENIYYEGDQVYYGDQPVATAEEYAQQADALAASARQQYPRAASGCRWAFSRSRRTARLPAWSRPCSCNSPSARKESSRARSEHGN